MVKQYRYGQILVVGTTSPKKAMNKSLFKKHLNDALGRCYACEGHGTRKNTYLTCTACNGTGKLAN